MIPQPGDPKPIIYLGSPTAKVLPLAKFWCLSYFKHEAHLVKQAKAQGCRIFLDSGAFSYLMQAQKRGQVLTPKDADAIANKYVDWVYAMEFPFDFIATFDYVRDPKIVLQMTRKIERRGLKPVPVYHNGTSITALHKLIDKGYQFIAIPRRKSIISGGNRLGAGVRDKQ